MGGYYYISRKQLLQAVSEKLGISKKFPKRNKTAHSRASLFEKLISSGPR